MKLKPLVKHKYLVLIFSIGLASLLAMPLIGKSITFSTAEQRLQEDTHHTLISKLDHAIHQTLLAVSTFAQKLKTDYSLQKNCESLRYLRNRSKAESKSSLYLPRSAKLDHRAACFDQAVLQQEELWNAFIQKTGFISWIYAYDSQTRIKRIMPTGNTQLLFGENLIFDSFSFYKDAVNSYPHPVWTQVKEDINGTGRILIATQAVQLGSRKRFSTVSADFRVNQIIKDHYGDLQKLADSSSRREVLLYLYAQEGGYRRLVSDFSLDVSLWSQLRPQDGNILNIPEVEHRALAELEAELSPAQPFIPPVMVTLAGKRYQCSWGRTQTVPLILLICTGN